MEIDVYTTRKLATPSRWLSPASQPRNAVLVTIPGRNLRASCYQVVNVLQLQVPSNRKRKRKKKDLKIN
jgi:hypothetical protein